MLTTVEVFDLIKQKQKIVSDNQLALRLGVTNGLISHHRKKPFGMSNDVALKCAPLAGIAPELLILWASAERAKCTEEAQVLRRVAAWVELRESEFRLGSFA